MKKIKLGRNCRSNLAGHQRKKELKTSALRRTFVTRESISIPTTIHGGEQQMLCTQTFEKKPYDPHFNQCRTGMTTATLIDYKFDHFRTKKNSSQRLGRKSGKTVEKQTGSLNASKKMSFNHRGDLSSISGRQTLMTAARIADAGRTSALTNQVQLSQPYLKTMPGPVSQTKKSNLLLNTAAHLGGAGILIHNIGETGSPMTNTKIFPFCSPVTYTGMLSRKETQRMPFEKSEAQFLYQGGSSHVPRQASSYGSRPITQPQTVRHASKTVNDDPKLASNKSTRNEIEQLKKTNNLLSCITKMQDQKRIQKSLQSVTKRILSSEKGLSKNPVGNLTGTYLDSSQVLQPGQSCNLSNPDLDYLNPQRGHTIDHSLIVRRTENLAGSRKLNIRVKRRSATNFKCHKIRVLGRELSRGGGRSDYDFRKDKRPSCATVKKGPGSGSASNHTKGLKRSASFERRLVKSKGISTAQISGNLNRHHSMTKSSKTTKENFNRSMDMLRELPKHPRPILSIDLDRDSQHSSSQAGGSTAQQGVKPAGNRKALKIGSPEVVTLQKADLKQTVFDQSAGKTRNEAQSKHVDLITSVNNLDSRYDQPRPNSKTNINYMTQMQQSGSPRDIPSQSYSRVLSSALCARKYSSFNNQKHTPASSLHLNPPVRVPTAVEKDTREAPLHCHTDADLANFTLDSKHKITPLLVSMSRGVTSEEMMLAKTAQIDFLDQFSSKKDTYLQTFYNQQKNLQLRNFLQVKHQKALQQKREEDNHQRFQLAINKNNDIQKKLEAQKADILSKIVESKNQRIQTHFSDAKNQYDYGLLSESLQKIEKVSREMQIEQKHQEIQQTFKELKIEINNLKTPKNNNIGSLQKQTRKNYPRKQKFKRKSRARDLQEKHNKKQFTNLDVRIIPVNDMQEQIDRDESLQIHNQIFQMSNDANAFKPDETLAQMENETIKLISLSLAQEQLGSILNLNVNRSETFNDLQQINLQDVYTGMDMPTDKDLQQDTSKLTAHLNDNEHPLYASKATALGSMDLIQQPSEQLVNIKEYSLLDDANPLDTNNLIEKNSKDTRHSVKSFSTMEHVKPGGRAGETAVQDYQTATFDRAKQNSQLQFYQQNPLSQNQKRVLTPIRHLMRNKENFNNNYSSLRVGIGADKTQNHNTVESVSANQQSVEHTNSLYLQNPKFKENNNGTPNQNKSIIHRLTSFALESSNPSVHNIDQISQHNNIKIQQQRKRGFIHIQQSNKKSKNCLINYLKQQKEQSNLKMVGKKLGQDQALHKIASQVFQNNQNLILQQNLMNGSKAQMQFEIEVPKKMPQIINNGKQIDFIDEGYTKIEQSEYGQSQTQKQQNQAVNTNETYNINQLMQNQILTKPARNEQLTQAQPTPYSQITVSRNNISTYNANSNIQSNNNLTERIPFEEKPNGAYLQPEPKPRHPGERLESVSSTRQVVISKDHDNQRNVSKVYIADGYRNLQELMQNVDFGSSDRSEYNHNFEMISRQLQRPQTCNQVRYNKNQSNRSSALHSRMVSTQRRQSAHHKLFQTNQTAQVPRNPQLNRLRDPKGKLIVVPEIKYGQSRQQQRLNYGYNGVDDLNDDLE